MGEGLRMTDDAGRCPWRAWDAQEGWDAMRREQVALARSLDPASQCAVGRRARGPRGCR